MRIDVKAGMLAGTVLCITGIVWFCTRQQIIKQPSIKFESQQPVPAAQRAKNPPTKPEEKSAVVEIGRVHIVAQGQTLSDISKIYYNNVNGWKRIYEANKEQFPKGPNIIKPGIRLIIPQ
ncbi:MAG: LysM peptidoglycan-binding domain-containing protein [Phycisphaerae bacterium]|jgi:nucleoid-associated protein YgaU